MDDVMEKMDTPQFIRVFSDLHLDFDLPQKIRKFTPDLLWVPEKLPDDHHTLLLIAGDLWHARKPLEFMGFSWLKEVAKNFQYVVVILGNHDFWGGNILKEYDSYKSFINAHRLSNVFVLQNNALIFGDLKLVGGTLWTDYNKGNSQCMKLAESGIMRDYKYIRSGIGFSRLKSHVILQEHLKTRNAIETLAKKDYPEQKLWVATHHVPTKESMEIVEEDDMQKLEAAFYYSDLDSLMIESEIDVWVHGHNHRRRYYSLSGHPEKRVIANPKGYPGEDTGFDPWSLHDLSGNEI